MANVYTATTGLSLDQAAWERRAFFPLRDQLRFTNVATVQATNQTMRGSSVNFYNVNELAVSATPIDEVIDVDTQTFTDSVFNLALAEYGYSTMTTALLRGTSFLPVQPIVADLIGRNAGVTMDTLARDALISGTISGNIVYGGSATARNQLTAADKLTADMLRVIYARLQTNNVATVDGTNYVLYAHPAVVKDLRAESGGLGWFEVTKYNNASLIYSGEIATFEGFRIITTPRAPRLAAAGASSATVYQTIIIGGEALAKAHSSGEGGPGSGFGPMPTIYPVPPTDNLARHWRVSWYWLGKFGAFRTAALYRVETGSSIA